MCSRNCVEEHLSVYYGCICLTNCVEEHLSTLCRCRLGNLVKEHFSEMMRKNGPKRPNAKALMKQKACGMVISKWDLSGQLKIARKLVIISKQLLKREKIWICIKITNGFHQNNSIFPTDVVSITSKQIRQEQSRSPVLLIIRHQMGTKERCPPQDTSLTNLHNLPNSWYIFIFFIIFAISGLLGPGLAK